MKKKMLTVAACAVTLVFSIPVLAQQVKFAADAEFHSLDESGCVSSYVFLFVRNGRTIESRETAIARLEMTIIRTDECRNDILLEARARANLRDGEISFDPQLGNTNLDATVQMVDRQSRNAINAAVVVNWAAIDEPITLDTRFEVEAPGQIVRRARPVATTLRLAEAFGTISVDGGPNLVPDTSADAAITSSR